MLLIYIHEHKFMDTVSNFLRISHIRITCLRRMSVGRKVVLKVDASTPCEFSLFPRERGRMDERKLNTHSPRSDFLHASYKRIHTGKIDVLLSAVKLTKRNTHIR